jgi:hypothetical protein
MARIGFILIRFGEGLNEAFDEPASKLIIILLAAW